MVGDLLTGTLITLPVKSLSLGHWFSSEDDLFEPWLGIDDFDSDEFHEEVDTGLAATLRIDLKSRKIEIVLDRSHDEEGNFTFLQGKNVLSFPLKYLLGPIELCVEGNSFHESHCLILSLKYPPRIESELLQEGHGLVNEDTIRVCRTKFAGIASEVIGRCLGLRLAVDKEPADRLFLNRKALKKMVMFGTIRDTVDGVHDAKPITTRRIGSDDWHLQRKFKELFERDAIAAINLRTSMDRGFSNWFCIVTDVAKMVESYCHESLSVFEIAQHYPAHFKKALREVREGKTKYPARFLMQLVQGYHSETEPENVPPYCYSINQVLLTPTRVASQGFETEMSNRVLRTFIEQEGFDSNSFIRVHLRDEDGQRLFSSDISVDVESRMRSYLTNGLDLFGELFQFFAFSSSQLKERSLWMVRLPPSLSIWKARGMLGDFMQCKSPSLLAARMGQCFSTTFLGLQASESSAGDEWSGSENQFHAGDITIVADVTSLFEGRKVCHSDGTGLIHRDTLTKVISRLPFGPKDPNDVSVMQIRLGGAKGTLLAIDPLLFDESPLPSGFRVALRPSMSKFASPCSNLEVCSIGGPIPYYLNRNVILLLSSFGVQDMIFLEMQDKMIADLDGMLSDKHTALLMLEELAGPDQSQRLMLQNMLQAGLAPSSEPFLLSALQAINLYHKFDLRKKARILVTAGVCLMGSLDPTGCLAEGCVFIQVCKQSALHGEEPVLRLITGPVMVTKHPVMHPGDIRMLLAVDIPALRSYRNVILFSQKGDRPEASKMSGSDLDGDLFAITWDSRLFIGDWNGCLRKSDGRFYTKAGKLLDVGKLSLANFRPQACFRYETPPLENKLQIDNTEKDLGGLLGHIMNCVKNFDFLDRGKTPVAHGRPQEYLLYETPPFGNSYLSDPKKYTNVLVEHLINYAKNDNLGQIGMLWQDWAALKGAGCQQCIDLATAYSIAVDFAKHGTQAHLAQELVLSKNEPRAHWREKNDSPSFQCNGPVGKLYDAALGHDPKSISAQSLIGVVGRKFDRYGSIISLTTQGWDKLQLRDVFNAGIPQSLGWMLREDISSHDRHVIEFALDRRRSYEVELVKIMHKFNIQSEGEVATGCVRKYHRLHNYRRHEISEIVKRLCLNLRQLYRNDFFLHALLLGLSGRDGSTIKDIPAIPSLEPATPVAEKYDVRWAENVSTAQFSSSDETSDAGAVRSAARKLAAAYYMVTYSPDFERIHDLLLFSFPWSVAGDVIACGQGPPYKSFQCPVKTSRFLPCDEPQGDLAPTIIVTGKR